jgi:CubicO group peptidase (beta-lactamase class C family)
MERHHVPGLGLGVVQTGDLAYVEGFGFADIAAGKPMTPETRQRIGSITKTMVALCVMALVDEGRLSLESRVADLLPDFRFDGPVDGLTVWHLLTHTGGIGEMPTLADMQKPFAKLFGPSDVDRPLAELYADGITIEVAPGTKWAYANHGFALLGEIVARHEGAPIAEVVQRRVFEPLGMNCSDLWDRPHPDLSHGYSQAETEEAWSLLRFMGVDLESEVTVDGHNLAGAYMPLWGTGAAGAVQSTVPDMALYARALLRGGSGVVQTATFRSMTSGQWQPDARLPGWGLGFRVADIAGHREFGHGGAVFGGWNTRLAVFPDLDAALLIHINVSLDLFEVLVSRLVYAFLGHEDPALPSVAPEPNVLATAPGVYELPGADPLTNFRPRFNCGRVQITSSEGGLTLHSRRGVWKDGVPLRPIDPAEPDLFAIDLDGFGRQQIALMLDDSGGVTGIRFPQLFEMRRNDEFEGWV